MLKTALLGAGSALLLGATASAQDTDVAYLDINGLVESQCSLGWGSTDGAEIEDLDFAVPTAAGEGAANAVDQVDVESDLVASCNGPYTLSVSSQNGRMENQDDASWWFTYRIDVEVDGGAPQSIEAAAAANSPQEIVDVDSYDFFQNNGSDLFMELDINFGQSTASDGGKLDERNLVAGNYADILTFQLEADPAF